MKKKAALLILNYNSQPFLSQCLESFLSQSKNDYEIWVIDNASSDNSVHFLRQNYPQIKTIALSKNFGVGKGFNEGIKLVIDNFTYIGLFNPDIRLDKNWLQESLATLETNPEADICASFILDWGGKKVDTAGGAILNLFTGVFGGFLGGKLVREVPPKYQEKEFPVFFGVVTAMLVRGEAFKNLGLLDEKYFMYFEDIDFSWRVLLQGRAVLCNPKAVVYHFGHGAKTSKNLSLTLLRKTEANLLATYYKNLHFFSFSLIFPLLLLARLIASLLYLFISPKITFAKVQGLSEFTHDLFRGKYSQDKSKVAKIRKRNDLQLLSGNPTALFSPAPLTSSLKKWLLVIKNVYQNPEERLPQEEGEV